jgi:hypothetical protein
MSKIPLFINSPVSETVLQAFPSIEEEEGFFFHRLKIDPDIFSLMIDLRPCVAVFSIPNHDCKREICDLLEDFKIARESLGYPKRDPTLRIILVAEEKTVSMERWHELGVHEFIIAPILRRALAYKINRHHQRALSARIPDRFQEQDEVIVLRGISRSSPRKPVTRQKDEIHLSEVPDPRGPNRRFLSEQAKPKLLTVVTKIPSLPRSEGHWEAIPTGLAKSVDRYQTWDWAWNNPDDQNSKPAWRYEGEKPEFDQESGAWNFSGEKPRLQVTPAGKGPENLIYTEDLPQGREVVTKDQSSSSLVDKPRPPRSEREAGEETKRKQSPSNMDVLEVKQTLSRRRQDQENSNLTQRSEPISESSQPLPRPESDSSSSEDPVRSNSAKTSSPRQRTHQSQRALERTMISDSPQTRERIAEDPRQKQTENEPNRSAFDSGVRANSSDEERGTRPGFRKNQAPSSPEQARPKKDTEKQPDEASFGKFSNSNEESQSDSAQETQFTSNDKSALPRGAASASQSPSDAHAAKQASSQKLPNEGSQPPTFGQLKTETKSEPSSRAPARSVPDPKPAWNSEFSESPLKEKPLGPDTPAEDQAEADDHPGFGNHRPDEKPDTHRIGNGDEDPNTWSMQNLDETEASMRKRKAKGAELPADDPSLFPTGTIDGPGPDQNLLNPEVKEFPTEDSAERMEPESHWLRKLVRSLRNFFGNS